MSLQDLLKEFLADEVKEKEFLDKMKENKIFTTSEENMDIRYKKLKDDFDAKDLEHQEAIKLIDELKQSKEGSEDLQAKLSEYETKIAELEAKNKEQAIESALRFALQDAKVTNVDYIAYQIEKSLKADNKALELDDNGQIKGINDLIEAQKKADPTFFSTEAKKEVEVKDLGKAKEDAEVAPESLVDALKQQYNPNTNI